MQVFLQIVAFSLQTDGSGRPRKAPLYNYRRLVSPKKTVFFFPWEFTYFIVNKQSQSRNKACNAMNKKISANFH